MTFKALRGTRDIFPEDCVRWQHIESVARQVAESFGYHPMRTPMLETTPLFLKAAGDRAESLEKELYSFKDRGGRHVSMRPDFTASVIRAYLEAGMQAPPQNVIKTYVSGPVFRYERSRSGRCEELYHFGIEAIGSSVAAMDAELISMAVQIFQFSGLWQTHIEISSTGCALCRPAHRELLFDFYEGHTEEQCDECRKHVERRDLRVLECKLEQCRRLALQAPTIFVRLCHECRSHFNTLQAALDAVAVDFDVNPLLVMGPDYYTRTIFRFTAEGQSGPVAVAAGGRYDHLFEALGGPMVPAAGFALHIDQVVEALDQASFPKPEGAGLDLFLVTIGEDAERSVMKALHHLRQKGVRVERDYMGQSLRSQLKSASRSRARYVAIVGDDQLRAGSIPVRDLNTNVQEHVSAWRLGESLYQYLRRRNRVPEPAMA